MSNGDFKTVKEISEVQAGPDRMRARLVESRKVVRLDIRRHYLDDNEIDFLPGKKGISISYQQALKLGIFTEELLKVWKETSPESCEVEEEV